jgi:hypothetical protein
MLLTLASNSRFSYLCLPSAGIIGLQACATILNMFLFYLSSSHMWLIATE